MWKTYPYLQDNFYKNIEFSILSAKVRKLSYLPIDDKFYGLDETEIELRQTTRQFFETEVGPHAYQIDKDDHYPEFRPGFLIG